MFCVPQRVTKKNPFEWRNELTDPEEWWGFCRYNVRDVDTEMLIKNRLIKYPILPQEWDLYALDQLINDRGVMIDTEFAQAALDLAERRKPQIIEEMKDITGLQNPNSVSKLVPWLKERGYPFDDVRQDTVKKVIREQEENGVDDEAITVLKARLNSAKSSIAKYKTMIDCAGEDGRFRYSLQFAGASRINRWAGRRLQTQNLARTPKFLEKVEDLTIANRFIANRELDNLALFAGEPMDALVGCIRSAIIPAPGINLSLPTLRPLNR